MLTKKQIKAIEKAIKLLEESHYNIPCNGDFDNEEQKDNCFQINCDYEELISKVKNFLENYKVK